MKNYGTLFLLFLAIGLILLAASGRGRAVWQTLTGRTQAPAAPNGTPPSSNPTDLGKTDTNNALGANGGMVG